MEEKNYTKYQTEGDVRTGNVHFRCNTCRVKGTNETFFKNHCDKCKKNSMEGDSE